MNNSKSANTLPENYDPLQDEVYMSGYMILYFRQKLENMLIEILHKENEISHNLSENPNREADYVDQGTNEELMLQDFTLQEYEDKRRKEVEEALLSIENGDYGYCAETGEPIGVPRLLSVPTAKYQVKIQEAKEH